METEITKQSTDFHPKISHFLSYLGIVIGLFSLLYTLIFGFNLGITALFIMSISYTLLGLKYKIVPKYISLRQLEILTFVVGTIGGIVLCCDLFFYIFPKFK